MRLSLIIGLIALNVSNVFAQAESRALPFTRQAVEILGAQTIDAASSVESAPIADPAEFLSIEMYTEPATLDLGDLSVSVVYASSYDGPYTAPTDTLSSNVTDTVSFTSQDTPTEGVDFRGAPAKYAKFTFANASAVPVVLNRLTALRQRVGHASRPQIMVDTAVDMGIEVVALADATESVSSTTEAGYDKPHADPQEFRAFSWDTSAGVGNRELRFFYSNSRKGPFVPWRDEGVEAVAYQNSITATALDAFLTAKLFPALYFQAKFYNGSGGATDVTHVFGIRHRQLKR